MVFWEDDLEAIMVVKDMSSIIIITDQVLSSNFSSIGELKRIRNITGNSN